MSKETEVILRTVLYQAMRAASLEEVVDAIKVMCDEETVAYVEKKVAENTRK
jgi:hypothetical protein